jgi:ribosomal protein S18 acetylase RimI-like enzyme
MAEAANSGAAHAPMYAQVARIHASRINQGFLATLGSDFLTLLYEAIDADPASVLIVERLDGVIVGFVAGGRGMGSIYRQMLKRWPRLIVALLPSLLNPSKLKRVLEVLWFSRQQKPVPGCPKAELLSIAVLERVQGRSVAQRLYQALTTHFDHAGEPAFCIVVGDALTPAHHFYRRMGAVPMAQISVHKGQGSTLYRHTLQASNKEGILG